jgi:hypothetical protein
MNPSQLRLSIALAHAVPGAALRLRARDGGAFFATDHPAGELTIDELRDTMLAGDLDGHTRLDDVIAEAEIGGSLMPMGAGVYLHEEEPSPTLWGIVPLSPAEIEAALDAVECPQAPASVEVIMRPDPELGATAIRVSSMLDVGEDPLLDVAVHVLGACLAVEVEHGVQSRPRH